MNIIPCGREAFGVRAYSTPRANERREKKRVDFRVAERFGLRPNQLRDEEMRQGKKCRHSLRNRKT
jgi:hypothetical protein